MCCFYTRTLVTRRTYRKRYKVIARIISWVTVDATTTLSRATSTTIITPSVRRFRTTEPLITKQPQEAVVKYGTLGLGFCHQALLLGMFRVPVLGLVPTVEKKLVVCSVPWYPVMVNSTVG